ncbi:hypothetical protein E2320_008647, partial [Naja naja]
MGATAKVDKGSTSGHLYIHGGGTSPKEPEMFAQMKILISEAITRGITAGLQQGHQATPPTVQAEVLPSPKLFLDLVHDQYNAPGSGPSSMSNDRRFYNVGPSLAKALQVPSVDAPVIASIFTSGTPTEREDMLKVDDSSGCNIWSEQTALTDLL